MENPLTLITHRRAEVEKEIARLRADIVAKERELVDLETAGRVTAQLSGAKWPPADEAEEKAAAATKPDNIPTMPEMIILVLRAAKKDGIHRLEPKNISAKIAKTYWPGVKTEAVSSIAWRMWKRSQLVKHGTAYMLPPDEKAAGQKSVGDGPAALFDNPEHDRKAGRGGGT